MSNNLASNNEFSFPYEDSSDITLESITRYLADLTGYSITSDIMGVVDLLHDLDSEQKKNEDFPFRSFRHLPVHWMPETAIPEVIPAVLHYIRWKLQDDTVIRKKHR